MFSSLGKIFSTQPRHAEHADARMEVRRHDPDQKRRKNQKNDKEEGEIFGDDHMSVSTEALHVFLENFLSAQKTAPEAEKQTLTETTDEASPPEAPKENNPPPEPGRAQTHGEAARAAGAYQNMARRHSETTSAPLAAQGIKDHHQMDIGAGDVRIIHALIKDLKELSKQGIQTLNIERSNTFLNSLTSAVDKIKHPERYH